MRTTTSRNHLCVNNTILIFDNNNLEARTVRSCQSLCTIEGLGAPCSRDAQNRYHPNKVNSAFLFGGVNLLFSLSTHATAFTNSRWSVCNALAYPSQIVVKTFRRYPNLQSLLNHRSMLLQMAS
jgi:hypothetical protein